MDSQRNPTPRAALETFQLHINGRSTPAASGKTFQTVDPFATRPWATVPDGGTQDIDAAVAAARDALQGPWGKFTGAQRSKLLRRLGELIKRDAERLARMEVRDSGKLYREMIFQLRYLPEWFNYYAGLADKIEGRTIPTDKATSLSSPRARRRAWWRPSRRGTRP